METELKIRIAGNSDLALDAYLEMLVAGIEIKSRTPVERGETDKFTQISVIIRSLAGFAVLYKLICKLLEKHENRKLTIIRDNAEIIITEHNIMDEEKLLAIILPEFLRMRGNDGLNNNPILPPEHMEGREIVGQLRRRLNILQLQRAKYGDNNVPPHILTEIEDVERDINNIEHNRPE
jgi:hypothetical protein